jgi:hypothetical protein
MIHNEKLQRLIRGAAVFIFLGLTPARFGDEVVLKVYWLLVS